MIVVGVDGSDVPKETLRFALDEARRWRTRLHVVHAFTEWEIPGTDEIEVDRSPEDRDAWLAAIVDEVVGAARDVEITRATVEDDPAPALLAAAQGAELLLIVGSRGHGGFADLLLGSVSQQCAHHAPCSVVIVRGQSH
jgi:nucleotide-binding universal stress UspA family protein